MSSVARNAAVRSAAVLWLCTGLAMAQELKQPMAVPPSPPRPALDLSKSVAGSQTKPALQSGVRQAVSYAEDDNYGSSTVTDLDAPGQLPNDLTVRSSIKVKLIDQPVVDSLPAPMPSNPTQSTTSQTTSPQATSTQSAAPQSTDYTNSPQYGDAIQSLQNLSPPYTGSGCGGACNSSCGPVIPYVPYTAAQAPYAPAFYPCPYYPPCYNYSGKLCATSPCLCCPTACGQPACEQSGAITVPTEQPGDMKVPTPSEQMPSAPQPNGQTGALKTPTPSQQASNGQKDKNYLVRRTSAMMPLNENGEMTQNTPITGDKPPLPPPDFSNDSDGRNMPGGNPAGSNPVSGNVTGSNPTGSNGNVQDNTASPSGNGMVSGGCSTCQSGGCSACQSGNCSVCDQCNSCGCDSCRHKCLPLFPIDDPCPLTCCDQPVDHVFGDCCCLQQNNLAITGWVDAGIMGNGRDTADHFNGPLTFADRNGEGQANQIWLSADRSAPANNCGWFIGGHVDYFFGSDSFFTTAAGLDGTPQGNTLRWNTDPNLLYGFSMPQLYVETDYDDWKIKWGHFFTIIGYETVPAIGNFFYSHSYAMQYGEPFTHTGFLVTKPTGDNWTWNGGLVAGWNTFDTDDRAAWLGGVTYADKDWGSLSFSIITGQESEFNTPGVGPFADRTMYSLVWTRNFTSRFSYVLQHDLGNQNDAQTARGGGAQWFGINQYLFYKLNCCWTAGMRMEWFRDDDGFVVNTTRPGNADDGASFPGDFYEITLGLNYKPNGNFAIRPEVRWDWYNGQPNASGTNPPVTSPYNAGASNNQLTFGADLIYQW
jgi:hypothetical protein